MLCVSEGTTVGTQSAKQLRLQTTSQRAPSVSLHCYALRRNKRSNMRSRDYGGSGLKLWLEMGIGIIYTFRSVFVLLVLINTSQN